MQTKPIIFSTEMVKAIMDGRKTQTRRVIRPQPICEEGVHLQTDGRVISYTPDRGRWEWRREVWLGGIDRLERFCPYGKPGDRLYIRETWNAISVTRQWWHETPGTCAEKSALNWYVKYKAWNFGGENANVPRWIPSIFMPKWASHITLEVKRVRVERVQSATWEDLCEEGLPQSVEDTQQPPAVVEWFRNLWDKINKKRGFGWSVNPWVWAVDFEVVKR
jgi:hypothetical protein